MLASQLALVSLSLAERSRSAHTDPHTFLRFSAPMAMRDRAMDERSHSQQILGYLAPRPAPLRVRYCRVVFSIKKSDWKT